MLCPRGYVSCPSVDLASCSPEAGIIHRDLLSAVWEDLGLPRDPGAVIEVSRPLFLPHGPVVHLYLLLRLLLLRPNLPLRNPCGAVV